MDMAMAVSMPPADAVLGLLGVPGLASSPNLPVGAIDQTAAVHVLVGPAYHGLAPIHTTCSPPVVCHHRLLLCATTDCGERFT